MNKMIRVTNENSEAIQAAITKTVSTERIKEAIFTAKDVIDAAARADAYFKLPTEALDGVTIDVERHPKRYQAGPRSAHFTIKHMDGGWWLTDVKKTLPGDEGDRYKVTLTARAHDELFYRMSRME